MRIPVLAGSALVLLVAACGTSSPAGTGPTGAPPTGYSAWPQAENSSLRTSLATATGPQTAAVHWKLDLGGASTEGPAIGADGTVYQASDAGVLRAVDPATGKVRWSYDGGGSIGGDLSTTPAVLPDGTIAWPGPQDTLYGLTPAGTVAWKVPLSGRALSPVVGPAGTLYEMSMGGDLYALSISGTSASVRWKLHVGGTSYGSPALRADGVLLTTVDKKLVAVADRGTKGAELWHFSTKQIIEVSPAVSPDGLTVLGTNDGNEYGISPTGKQVWKHAVQLFSYSSPAVTGDHAYFGDNRGTLTEVVTATGEVVREDNASPGVPNPGNIWTAPLVDAAGDVYYGTNDGHVYGYGPTGTQLFDLEVGGTVSSYPAMTADGHLLIASADGNLYDIGA